MFLLVGGPTHLNAVPWPSAACDTAAVDEGDERADRPPARL
jgi:hypothetical protein